MKKNIIATLMLAMALSGCAKLHVLPQNASLDNTKAITSFYEYSQLKRSGGEKRVLSSDVKMAAYSNRLEAEKVCLAHVKRRAQNASVRRDFKVISSRTSTVNDANLLTCEINAFVWP